MGNSLCIDGFCGVGGWTEGFLEEGWDVIGFDIERHVYGKHRYPAQLVIQDMLTIHGSQFVRADCLVMSPPCQKYSYMAMPWSRSKALRTWYRDPSYPERLVELNALFDACFRIQREASEAAGRHIPMVVENVRGAQDWVGRARWNFGSYYLFGDVPALMPPRYLGQFNKIPPEINDAIRNGKSPARWTNAAEHYFGPLQDEGIKCGGDWFNASQPSISRMTSSKSSARKVASAMIAKIPLRLARHIAKVYHP